MISVIIPTYNEEKYLGILLESLKGQDCAKDIEVVIADANSKDRTREVATSYIAYFKRLIIVDGGMPAIGRNKGAAASEGDLLFFIDADLRLDDRMFLSKCQKYFRDHELGISTVHLEPLSKKWIDIIYMLFYSFVLDMSKYFRALGAMCIVADRIVFEKVGGYPEDVVMNEDHELMLNASRVGKYEVMPYEVQFSVRRFEKEGRLNLIWKYAQATYFNLTRGPIRKPIFEYQFGYDDQLNKK